MFENSVVYSKAFGTGIITSLKETPEIYSHMIVDFNGNIKKFAYPLCFEKHLTTENLDLEVKSQLDLVTYVTLEEEKKKARIKAVLSKLKIPE